MSADSVGSLLADIAILIHDGLRIMSLVDKRQWGPDEHEQVRALDMVLDEAKRDFQELSPLVNGQVYYENDRKLESLHDLRLLRGRFSSHIQNFKDWARAGGPINPTWAKDTSDLGRALHRAQCRAARRIFTTGQESPSRCLGAWLVWRRQRVGVPAHPARGRNAIPMRPYYPDANGPDSDHNPNPNHHHQRGGGGGFSTPPRPRPRPPKSRSRSSNSISSMTHVPLTPVTTNSSHTSSLDEDRELHRAARRRERTRLQLEEIAACNSVGRFERQGDADIAFVCDYCDGYIVWEDIESMPSTRTVDDMETEELPSLPSPPASAFLSRVGRGGGGPYAMNVRPVVRSSVSAQGDGGPRSSIASIASSSSTGTETPVPTPTTTASMMSRGGPRPAVPSWRATGFSHSSGEEKEIVFAPLAVASHVAPDRGEWRSRILCPYCDGGADDTGGGGGGGGGGSHGANEEDDELDDGDEDDERWVGEENGFEDMEELMEHLWWQHGGAGGGVYGLGFGGLGMPGAIKRAESCVVM